MSRAAFAALLVLAAPAAAQTQYLEGIEDFPLAPGLVEAGPGFSFEDAHGRISAAVARGPAASDAVRRFYLDALPALGWSLSPGAGADGGFVFLRGRERLALTIGDRGDATELEVRLFVRPASMDAD